MLPDTKGVTDRYTLDLAVDRNLQVLAGWHDAHQSQDSGAKPCTSGYTVATQL